MTFKRKIVAVAISGMVLCVAVIGTCYIIVSINASGRTYDDIEAVPHNTFALLLATSPVTPTGERNFNFDNRIMVAEKLYNAGKIEYIIASGGDYTQSQAIGCDEPQAILDSLTMRGIPSDRIILDYDGTRTLNSIAKAQKVYDLDSLTLISQRYHNERAIYLADKYGIEAVGYNAAPSAVQRSRVKNAVREYLARVKMFLEVIIGLYPDIKND